MELLNIKTINMAIQQIQNGDSGALAASKIFANDNAAASLTWTVADVGLTYPARRELNGIEYRVRDGKTTTALDTPFENSTVWEILGMSQFSKFNDYLKPMLEQGAIALNTGGLTSSTTRGRTVSFIDIKYAQKIDLIGDMLIQAILYYTSSGVWISTQTVNAKTVVPVVPSGATKFKITLYHVTNTQTVTQAELDALDLRFISSDFIAFSDIINGTKNSKKVVTDYDNTIINSGSSAYVELGGLNVADGSDANNNIRIRSSRIQLDRAKYYITQPAAYRVSRVMCYMNGVFVKSSTNIPVSEITVDETFNGIRIVWEKLVNTEVITPAEVAAFTFLLQNPDANKFDAIIKMIPGQTTETVSWFKGKKMTSLGDSITYGFIPRNYPGYPGQLDSFAKQTAALLNMQWENRGISGSTLGRVSESNPTERNPMVDRYTALSQDAKVITFMGGTNDIRNISILGVMDDRTPYTYYGALHMLIQGLLNRYIYSQSLSLAKDILIIGISPIKIYPDSTHNDLRMLDYVSAMKEVCEYYAIPFFNAYDLSGLTPSEFRTLKGTEVGYTDMYNPLVTDGVHPTAEGNAILASRLAGWMQTLVSKIV